MSVRWRTLDEHRPVHSPETYCVSDDLTPYSLRELSRFLRTGELTSLSLFERTLSAAEDQDKLGAFVTIAPEIGEAQALDSDRRLKTGQVRPLEGLPVPLKDVEATRGLRTTNGSLAFHDWVPDTDGGAANAARKAGATVFLKTNTTEFALTEQSDNPLGITTRNPRNLALTSGGSSAGAAAAVAAGIIPAAHGSDGAGSVRLPAALCGIIGFKPSYGLIPRYPVSDQWGGRSHHGILGRTVDDVRFAMQGFARVDSRDPFSFPLTLEKSSSTKSIEKLSFAMLDTWGNAYVDPEVKAAVAVFSDRLEEYGLSRHTVTQTPEVGSVFEKIYLPQLAYDIAQLDDHHQELIGDEVRYWVSRATEIDFQQYMVARDQRGQLMRWCSEAFAELDFVVLPAQHRLAWAVDEPNNAADQRFATSIGERLQFLAVFNLLGWPAISVPIGQSKDGREIGIQLACKRGEDAKLLDIAESLQQLFGV